MSKLSSEYNLTGSTILIAAVFIFGLLTSNALLLIQNRNMKFQQNIGKEIVPSVGKKMSDLTGLDLNEEKKNFAWNSDERKTLLLIFPPRCGFCHENMPNWKYIVDKIDQKTVRVLAVSSIKEGTKEYIEKYGFDQIPVISEPDPKNVIEYGMYVTPQTILLDKRGKVEKIWLGPIQDEQKNEIERDVIAKQIN